ncbi:outer membrane autotransporter barrel domain-containing protein [Bartonella tamiae Th307]|uniref:Outer membrane autotransporter barrel domain-containing protein n=1 Tax=Bartonella tamiae Th239 TaxID=1094558 RepID=J1JZV0_9HYPH|nr:outer membrane autotransporter barrel domain-containing protein [Bartonella tamiae Th239]EJF93774.1 outer membrane autotransporter barrel domain-containing protein [Bartonella tamiae Th307]
MISTQFGLDFVALDKAIGQVNGGVYFQYGHNKMDVFSRFGKGVIKNNGYGFGVTLTW